MTDVYIHTDTAPNRHVKCGARQLILISNVIAGRAGSQTETGQGRSPTGTQEYTG